MRLYYRVDTRSPKTIFQDGFVSRNNSSMSHLYSRQESNWWQMGIRGNGASSSSLPKTTTTDADMNNPKKIS